MGASTLGPTPPAQAWGDALGSIGLVGTTTFGARTLDRDEPEAPRAHEPIEAARAWLADPARRSRLAPDVIARAEATLDIAAAHLRELDLLAGQVALEANESGAIDPLRLERVDLMAAVVRAWAERLRTLLDEDAVTAADDVARRLEAALEAARGGGLSALVAAL